MRISIVIPCYNMQDYLPQCLDSIYRQDLEESEYEVIVVNDGSKDDTSVIAHEYAAEYSNITVIDKQNAGVGAARNTGLDRASAPYIYFLDPDDYLADKTLGSLLQVAEENDLDVLSFYSREVKKDGLNKSANLGKLKPSIEIRDGITQIAYRKFQNEIWWWLVKKSFLDQKGIRFIEGRWMEDAILTAQVFTAAGRIIHWPLDVHRYRILPTSAMRNKTPEHYNKVIFDNANAAEVFDGLIASLPTEHPKYEECRRRLKTRQQSFVFFLLVRLMKSDLKLSEIKPLLKKFEPIQAYPLNDFLGPDYNGFAYRILVYIFNRKDIIVPFMRLYRLISFNFN